MGRKTREKEEDELSKLKEKQAKRKEIRAEQEKKLNQQKREEEEKLKKEEGERKASWVPHLAAAFVAYYSLLLSQNNFSLIKITLVGSNDMYGIIMSNKA